MSLLARELVEVGGAGITRVGHDDLKSVEEKMSATILNATQRRSSKHPEASVKAIFRCADDLVNLGALGSFARRPLLGGAVTALVGCKVDQRNIPCRWP